MTPADKDHPAGFPRAGILADDLESTVMALQKEGLKVQRRALEKGDRRLEVMRIADS